MTWIDDYQRLRLAHQEDDSSVGSVWEKTTTSIENYSNLWTSRGSLSFQPSSGDFSNMVPVFPNVEMKFSPMSKTRAATRAHVAGVDPSCFASQVLNVNSHAF